MLELLTPAGLKEGEMYYIVGENDDPLLQAIASILRWAAPTATCAGLGITPPQQGTIVLYQHDALQRAAGFMSDRSFHGVVLKYLPVPFDYPWGFWAAWSWYQDRPELLDSLTGLEAYRQFCGRCAYLGGDALAGRIDSWASLENDAFYWNELRPTLCQHEADLSRVRAGLADNRSREVYDLAIQSDPQTLWCHFITSVFGVHDYLESGRPGAGDVVLDLGIFSGHEIPALLTLVGSGGKVYAFDPLGSDLFSPYVRHFVDTCAERLHLGRVGAGARAEDVAFRQYPDGQLCRDCSGSGKSYFKVVPLDSYFAKSDSPKIDFVKVDIEGMEMDAMEGLKQTLNKCRPTISIAIYHSAEHLWQVPLWLMKELAGYNFYVDHFSPFRWETIITAIPADKDVRA